jgi:hypothetical protein
LALPLTLVGKPKFTKESKKYWEKMMIKSPMYSTGPSVSLNMYVGLLLLGTISHKDEWWVEKPEEWVAKCKSKLKDI